DAAAATAAATATAATAAATRSTRIGRTMHRRWRRVHGGGGRQGTILYGSRRAGPTVRARRAVTAGGLCASIQRGELDARTLSLGPGGRARGGGCASRETPGAARHGWQA